MFKGNRKWGLYRQVVFLYRLFAKAGLNVYDIKPCSDSAKILLQGGGGSLKKGLTEPPPPPPPFRKLSQF